MAAATASIEAKINQKAHNAFVYSLVGVLGLPTLIVCPLAFVYANQALSLIRRYRSGEQYAETAKNARLLAAVLFLFYVALGAWFLAALYWPVQ